MNVRFHPAARAELRHSLEWYEDRSPVSATAFAQEINAAIARIVEAPTGYPNTEHGTRRLVLERFPFNIFYRAGQTHVLVVAVAHQKRRPGYWQGRI